MKHDLVVNFWTALLSILIAGNGYFIKRLVDKLDSTEAQVYAVREDVASIKARLDDLIASTMDESEVRNSSSSRPGQTIHLQQLVRELSK